jgi:hypothetical protein
VKIKSITIAAVLATLCCPILSAIAHDRSPAVTHHKTIAISTNAIVPSAVSPAQRVDAAPAPAEPAQPDLGSYTGILLDVSGYSTIQRSPAPAIYGPSSDLVYPDRSHVPTPDQVQDESIVRYYRSMNDAEAGVCGTHPLVHVPTAVVGPAKDSVTLSAADAETFKALDKKIHFTDNWKVGFLIPSNQ